MLSLSFAKLVATPTETAWSQVYNAGNLFACLSLSKDPEDNETQLNSIGKEMFSYLESEFFTLEDKDLQSIKESIANSTHTIPSSVSADLCLVYFKDNILYVFIYGLGAVIMKRDKKVGVLLDKHTSDGEIKSASGFLENDDTIVLQTSQFAKDMSEETISGALDLDLPNDIAEALSPAMHEKDDGGQAAIIINYKDLLKPTSIDTGEDFKATDLADNRIDDELTNEVPTERESTIHIEKVDENITEDELIVEKEEIDVLITDNRPVTPMPEHSGSSKSKLSNLITSLKLPFLKKKNNIQFNHRKKLFLTIAVILIIVLLISVSFTKKRESDSKNAALFASVYEPALENYEDGKSVQSINNEFARDDFLKAKTQLLDGQGKFKKGTKEEKQITELLSKVEAELGGGTTTVIKPKEASVGTNSFLNVVKANSTSRGFTKDQNGTYFITDKAIVSVSGSGTKKDIKENDGDWEKPAGLATYQGNMYVLDQTNGVLKFTAGSSGFGKSSYFKTTPSNISSAQAIAIDGSVWILFKDGSIMKYTRGESDGFKTQGLDKPFKNPTKLFTNLDTENLYVLDTGNGRIVKLDKDGDFQTQYNAAVLKSAKDLEVSEKDGKILVLSNGKTWEIPL
ncbi:MAG TPA: hypothetical protein VNA13_00415 [Xanthomonadales bacterium]|nr:hypothetical protein [Xanthomonadales bacterium]